MFTTQELNEIGAEWLASVRRELRLIDELKHDIWQLEQFQARPECSRQEFHWAKLMIQSIKKELADLEDA